MTDSIGNTCHDANKFLFPQFCLCLTEAILLFSAESCHFCFCSHKLQWIVQALVLVAATLGLVFIVSSKNRSERPHLVSWHSVLGLLTFLGTCGQVLCGLCLCFPRLLGISSVDRLQLFHTIYGLIVYLLATFTVVLGIYSDWFQAQIKGVAWYFCLVLPFCPAVAVLKLTTRTHLPKKREYI